jgi:hypothetical protein
MLCNFTHAQQNMPCLHTIVRRLQENLDLASADMKENVYIQMSNDLKKVHENLPKLKIPEGEDLGMHYGGNENRILRCVSNQLEEVNHQIQHVAAVIENMKKAVRQETPDEITKESAVHYLCTRRNTPYVEGTTTVSDFGVKPEEEEEFFAKFLQVQKNALKKIIQNYELKLSELQEEREGLQILNTPLMQV